MSEVSGLQELNQSQIDNELTAIEYRKWLLGYYYYMANVYLYKWPYDKYIADWIKRGGPHVLDVGYKNTQLPKVFNSGIDVEPDDSYIRNKTLKQPVRINYVVDVRWDVVQAWFSKQTQHLLYSWPNKHYLTLGTSSNTVEFWKWPFGVMLDDNGIMIPRGHWLFDTDLNELDFIGEPDRNTGSNVVNPWKVFIPESVVPFKKVELYGDSDSWLKPLIPRPTLPNIVDVDINDPTILINKPSFIDYLIQLLTNILNDIRGVL